MSDWFKQITTLISSPEEKETTIEMNEKGPLIIKKLNKNTIQTSIATSCAQNRDASFSIKPPAQQPSVPATINDPKEGKKNMSEDSSEGNLKALKRLRALPRGTQVESRIAAIENLLGEEEIFKTLKMLRWPQGIICPRCHSTNVVRRNPPVNARDQRHYYDCLDCKDDGSASDFDDFTDLPISSLHALRQWILCWYLIGFCSVHQIAKVLGLSINEVMQMASYGSEITELPDHQEQLSAKKRHQHLEKKSQEHQNQKSSVETQENSTRSESRAPLKPGYKSKK